MIRCALLSVSDKSGIVSFARALIGHGAHLLSTGGTLEELRRQGVPAEQVSDYTASPEVMAGRVKTLHPRVHGGILARLPRDEAELERIGGRRIDMVVVNLYPFEETLARQGASAEEVIENIDIGGPSMLRSGAKNHDRVTVVCDPADYDAVAAELASGQVSLPTRRRLAAKAFAHTAAYDGAIAEHLSRVAEAEPQAFAPSLTLALERVATLRYGENPHQRAALYRDRRGPEGSLARATEVGAGAKELSFNNYVDLDAAWAAVREHEGPAAAVVKHTNPCGLAVAATLAEAYVEARAGDPQSAFGGIVALNREVDAATADKLAETFIECVVAPSFAREALARLSRKKSLRLVQTGRVDLPPSARLQRIDGGFVVQDGDDTAAGEVAAARVASRRPPTLDEQASLEFAWRVAKHVKSNAIVLAQGSVVVGVGAGQMSRVDAVRLAIDKAGARATGAVLASDAFFPFADGVELAAGHGIVAIAQPGGSVKDDEVIAAADAAGMAMVLTGVRHFRH